MSSIEVGKTKKQIAGERLRQARSNGALTYISPSNCKCGTNIRYTSTRSCVSCTKVNNQLRKKALQRKRPCLAETRLPVLMKEQGLAGQICRLF